MLDLSEELILTLDIQQVEHRLLYVRYMLKREVDEAKLMKYQFFLELLEERKATISSLETSSTELSSMDEEIQ